MTALLLLSLPSVVLRHRSSRRHQQLRSVGAAAVPDTVAAAEKAAALFVLDAHIRPGQVVAIGDGAELLSRFTSALGERFQSGALPGCSVLAVSSRAEAEASMCGLRLALLGTQPDVLVEEPGCVCHAPASPLVWTVQPCCVELRRAQEAREAAKEVVLLAQPSALQSRISNVAVAVGEWDWNDIAEELDDMFLGDAEVWRRPSSGTADPTGGPDPLSLEDGSTVLELRFDDGLRIDGQAAGAGDIAAAVENVAGVRGHGLAHGKALCCVVPALGADTPRVLFPSSNR